MGIQIKVKLLCHVVYFLLCFIFVSQPIKGCRHIFMISLQLNSSISASIWFLFDSIRMLGSVVTFDSSEKLNTKLDEMTFTCGSFSFVFYCFQEVISINFLNIINFHYKIMIKKCLPN